MPVAAAFPVWLVVCLFAFLAMSGVVTAGILEVGPDAFPEGIVLNNVFPGVTLSNETVRGDPDQTDVLARSGTTLLGPTAGQNVASTGELVFGRESAPGPSDSLIFWSGVPFAPTVDSAVLWANFHIVEALSVEVDARANDNDVFELRAFDASDNEVSPPGVSAGGTNVLLPMNITSSSWGRGFSTTKG